MPADAGPIVHAPSPQSPAGAEPDAATSTGNALQVDVLQGDEAERALADPAFIDAWARLLAHSAHGTAYQAPAFVGTWYRSYGADWRPVLVRGRDAGDALAALWTLAHDGRGRLVHAGAHQAEYHVWLAPEAVEAEFLRRAWPLLTRALAFDTLAFKYLPSRAALATLQGAAALTPLLDAALHARPLIRLDARDIESSFAKKSNKSRFNRLKKLGTLEFAHLASGDALLAVFDDFCTQYDLRQGAVNQSTPFCDDPRKRDFHLDLFAASDRQTCDVSVTLLDGRLAAGLWGLRSGGMVHLGMLAHSPLLAEHSPGKLHLMQLSRSLLAAGVQVLDLTPGGDPWKERFANDHDEVATATLYRHAAQRQAAERRRALQRRAKRLAGAVGITPEQLRSRLRQLRRATPARLAAHLGRWASESREFRIYRTDRAVAERFAPSAGVRCNELADLLAYRPGESWQTREGFLAQALQRLERGELAHTVLTAGQLAHSGWLAFGQTESRMTEVEQLLRFPPGSVALYDFYSHPDFRGRGLYRATLGHMLHEAFSRPGTQWAYISVLADNGPSRHVIESMGFAYQGSFHFRRRFGSVAKWADPSVAGGAEAGDA